MADTSLPTDRLRNGHIRCVTALLAGVVFALGQAPYDLWYIATLGLVAAFWLYRGSSPKLASALGWCFGLGYFGLGMAWIVEPFLVDRAATGWLAPFGLIGLAGGLSLFWAAAFGLAARLSQAPVAALILSWSAAELARAYVLTGFPWALVGYLWAPSWAIQWVALIGPHGLTFATLILAALLAARPTLWRHGTAFVLLAALLLGGKALQPAAQALEDRPVVRLIQPNAAQNEKWDPAMIPIFYARQLAFTEATSDIPPDLVIWPEMSLPMLLERADTALAEISAAAGDAHVMVGLQRRDANRYYNSLVTLSPDGAQTSIYDKHHLVPFGEYMPAAALFARFNIMGLAARASSAYSAGPGPQLVSLGPLGTALPLICYEAVFPQGVNRAPDRPDFLIQSTNDAWFGTWAGPYQHLAQARIRAIEQGLPMLRSANTGVSAVIDPAGRILASLPLGEAGFVDAPIPRAVSETWYRTSGDAPLFVLLILCAAALRTALRWKNG